MQHPEITVYHDGACPLCRLEIEHYRRQDRADRIAFVDVSNPGCSAGPDLSRSAAMSRFHVRMATGELRDGARAFAAVWAVLPQWRWAARLASVPGAIRLLDLAYAAFLPLRPILARSIGAFRKVDDRTD